MYQMNMLLIASVRSALLVLSMQHLLHISISTSSVWPGNHARSREDIRIYPTPFKPILSGYVAKGADLAIPLQRGELSQGESLPLAERDLFFVPCVRENRVGRDGFIGDEVVELPR